jgi:hypothetical protein
LVILKTSEDTRFQKEGEDDEWYQFLFLADIENPIVNVL